MKWGPGNYSVSAPVHGQLPTEIEIQSSRGGWPNDATTLAEHLLSITAWTTHEWMAVRLGVYIHVPHITEYSMENNSLNSRSAAIT